MFTWKQNFSQTLSDYFYQRLNVKVHGDQDVYRLYQSLTESQRRGMWVTIGETLNVKSKQIHDYFHNTWIKRFYDDLNPYKDQLMRLLQKEASHSSGSTHEIVNHVIQQFQQQYPRANIHVQSTYIFLYTQLKRHAERYVPTKPFRPHAAAPRPEQQPTPSVSEDAATDAMVSLLRGILAGLE